MIINSSLCYIQSKDKYLMLHRIKKKNDINKDKWIGVGGKFEDGESPFDCVIREALEETGIRLLKPDYRGIVTFVADGGYTEQMHLFTCNEFSGDIPDYQNSDICPEGRLEWVKIKDIPSLPIWEGDRIFLRLLCDSAPFFSLKLIYSGDNLSEVCLNGEKIPR